MTLTLDSPRASALRAYREDEGLDKLDTLLGFPQQPLSVDTETTGLKTADGTDIVIGVSIATVLDDGTPISHYFPTAHASGPNISPETLAVLWAVLTQQGRPLIYANVQFDVCGLLHAGVDVRMQEFYDILTMANLINENMPKMKSLDNLGKHYVGAEKVKDAFVDSEKKSGNKNITGEQMFEYAVVDAELTYRVWCQLIIHPNWVELSEQTDVWEEKQKLIRVLIAMRLRGILIDMAVATEMEAIGTIRMAELQAELAFNPGSHKDMHRIFIEELGFPVLKRSKKTKAPSFDNEVMEQYDEILARTDNPLAKTIKEYRGWQKATTAAYRPYITLVDPDGRIRCSFNTHRTSTGRLSSSDPNLQQIPKESDKEWSKRVKSCFIAKPGFTLISLDYSQLELRMATAYSGEQSLKAVFAEDRDLFTEMALELAMTRPNTKTFVYSIQYGAGEKKTMTQFGVTKEKAQQMRANYSATYPSMSAFNTFCTARAERDLKVKIWSGRYRHFAYKSEGYKAMNSVIQGGSADVVERVMVRVFDEFESDDCHMLLQVHDALVFEIRDEMVDELTPRIRAMMEDVNGAIPAHLDGAFDVKFNVEASPWLK